MYIHLKSLNKTIKTYRKGAFVMQEIIHLHSGRMYSLHIDLDKG